MNELASTDESRNTLPPLRIHHMMIWMVAVAVVLSFYGEMIRAVGSELTLLATFTTAVTLVLYSMAVATLALGIYWKIKGRRFFDEVGHWLLVSSSLSLLSNSLFVLLYLFSTDMLESPGVTYYYRLFPILYPLLLGVLYIVAFKMAADTATWRRFCKHVGVMCLLGVLLQVIRLLFLPDLRVGRIGSDIQWQFVSGIVTFGVPIYWGILCALSVRKDLLSGRRRHWSHWCGIIIWLAAALLQMAPSLFS